MVSPAFSEEEARNFHDTIKNALSGLGGLIEENGSVLKKRLAYPIKKMREAYLANFKFMLEPEKLEVLKQKLGVKDVLRYSLVQTKRVPQRIMRPRIFKAVPLEKISVEKKIEVKPMEPRLTEEGHEAANIAEIDKKLEEILGK